MEERLLPIGIDSEGKHVKSEIDRVDAIFAVTTGPVGRQEVNYRIIDEGRDRRTIQQSSHYSQPINESSKEKSSLKSKLSPLQYRRTIEFIDSEILNHLQENRLVSKKGIQPKTSDDSNRKARFSLPEIDSSNHQEKKYQIRKGIKIFVENFYAKYFSQ
jgi:hypothetical protein